MIDELNKDLQALEAQILKMRDDIRNLEDDLEIRRTAETQAQGAVLYVRSKITALQNAARQAAEESSTDG